MTEVRQTPRFSINKLVDYLTANAAKRRRIIEAQKRPVTFRLNWYESAQNTICNFLLDQDRDESIISSEIEKLYSAIPENDQDESKNITNAEALESFLEAYEKIDFNGLVLQRESNQCPKLRCGATDISVRPEIIAAGNYRNLPIVGGLKLYFSKDNRLDDNSSKYITAVLFKYLEDHRSSKGSPNRSFTLVMDVFGGVVYNAPISRSRRFKDIDAACEEIALWWPTL